MPLEQITTDYDQTIPQSKLKSMQSAKERADNVAQGKMLNKTVASPAQLKADADEIAKKKIGVMQKISPSARRSAIMNRNMDARDKKSMLEKVYDKITGKDD